MVLGRVLCVFPLLLYFSGPRTDQTRLRDKCLELGGVSYLRKAPGDYMDRLHPSPAMLSSLLEADPGVTQQWEKRTGIRN